METRSALKPASVDQFKRSLYRRALGGWKQSGIDEEECFDEILSYTQIKNINMRW
jgi:hypothetical protein